MDVLTPSQYAILSKAWQTNGFTIEELSKSKIGDGRKDATLRTVCDRIVEKGYMRTEKKKGTPVKYLPACSKQDYMIKLAKAWFKDATEEDKKFFKWAMDQV